MSKASKIEGFDPNGLGDRNNNIYGLPFTCDEAEVVIVPVPWDVTVSYSDGTSKGPEAVYNASMQVDLYDPIVKDAWKLGLAMDEVPAYWVAENNLLREKAIRYIDMLEEGHSPADNDEMAETLNEVNAASAELNTWVKNKCTEWMNKGKLVALLGGEHSTPLGLMQALGEKYPGYAILQVDAHADLRDAYEGFEFSHASVMFNALKIQGLGKLVQVGIRDYCQAEADLIANSNGRVVTFFDRDIKQQQFGGMTWHQQCDAIIATLPEHIYISFDIDGLDPKLCPNTGTPVAGGFELEQAVYLIQQAVKAGKKIIALDLNEVAPHPDGHDEWDANVGARLLFRMCNLMALSQNRFGK